MNTNEVFDLLFREFPKARESSSMNRRPKGALKWKKQSTKKYVAVGPRGGILHLSYNEKSNKITLVRHTDK